MTCSRRAGSVEAAIMDCLDELSNADIREFTGWSPKTLYAKANPNTTNTLSLVEAASLDAAMLAKGLGARFGDIFAAMVQDKLIGRRSNSSGDITQKLTHLVIGNGELHKLVDDGMADGTLDRHERRAIANKAQDLIDGLSDIRDICEPPHEGAISLHEGAA